jgi:salicylate hydroxylase
MVLMKYQHIVAYPIRHGKMINFVAFVSQHDLENTTFDGSWTSTTETSEFAHEFSCWDPEVQVMIEVCLRPLDMHSDFTDYHLISASRNHSVGQYTP